MKRKLMYVIMVIAAMASLTSCDEHESIDLDVHPGYILCDDGCMIIIHTFPLLGFLLVVRLENSRHHRLLLPHL